MAEQLVYNYTPKFLAARDRIHALVKEAKNPKSPLGAKDIRDKFREEMLALGQIERIENLYRIYDKASNSYVQFKLKPAQRKFLEEASGRDLILKSRQIGFTTLAVALGYDEAIWHDGRCGIMAHKQDTVKKIFEMARRMNEYFVKEYGAYCPLEEESNSVSRLSWKNIKGSIDVAYEFQGYTLTRLHVSEAAFIDSDRLTNSMQAVPESGRIILESTPNGPGGYYYNVYQDWKKRRGSAPFRGHFFPWFENYPEQPDKWCPDGRDMKLDAQEQELIDLYKLQDFHILYRRFKLAEMGGDAERFENQYPSDDMSCFLSGENNVYPTSILKQQGTYVCEPAFVGNLQMDGKTVRFVTDTKKGLVKIWDLPKPGKVYYGGADPSGGTGGDPGAAVLVDVQTGQQVAQLQGFMDPDLFADELFKLGQYYNQAFWCIEQNNHGHAVILKLKSSYPNLYRRQQFDSMTKKLSPVVGFYTTNSEKVAITDNHVAACREGKFKTRSQDLLNEMGTFVQLSSEAGRTLRREARVGCHDDLVIAACLCWEMVRSRPIPDFTNEQYDMAATRGLSVDPDTGFLYPNDSYQEDNWF